MDVEDLPLNKKKEHGEPDDSEETFELNDKKSRQIAMILKMKKHKENPENATYINKMAPYVLQVAMGIHAVFNNLVYSKFVKIFEGMAIGIAQSTSACLGVALAVLGHKWAEGFTLVFYRIALI